MKTIIGKLAAALVLLTVFGICIYHLIIIISLYQFQMIRIDYQKFYIAIAFLLLISLFTVFALSLFGPCREELAELFWHRPKLFFSYFQENATFVFHHIMFWRRESQIFRLERIRTRGEAQIEILRAKADLRRVEAETARFDAETHRYRVGTALAAEQVREQKRRLEKRERRERWKKRWQAFTGWLKSLFKKAEEESEGFAPAIRLAIPLFAATFLMAALERRFPVVLSIWPWTFVGSVLLFLCNFGNFLITVREKRIGPVKILLLMIACGIVVGLIAQ